MRRATFVASLLVAAAAFTMPWIFRREGFDLALKTSFWLAALWMLIVVATLVQYRLKGLWLVLSAPLALFWPALITMAVLGCAHGGTCL
jgi:hypothetical protein